MPKLTGVFSYFKDLDQVSVDNVASFVKSSLPKGTPIPSSDQIADYLANKILYPHAVAVTLVDFKVDLAILREALKFNKQFLDIPARKIIIPSEFLDFITDLSVLTSVFVDAYLLEPNLRQGQALWTIVTQEHSVPGNIIKEEAIGSLLIPNFQQTNGKMDIFLEGNSYVVNIGSLVILKCPKQKCLVGFKSSNGGLMGKNEGVVEVWGGRLGLMVDTRTV